MALCPRHLDILTPDGVTRVAIRYVRPFTQLIPVQVCWLFSAGVDHACDEYDCWPAPEGEK